jgi:hypothetical protein
MIPQIITEGNAETQAHCTVLRFTTRVRPFQENKPPKYKLSSEEKASGLEGFKFWNYLSTKKRPANRFLGCFLDVTVKPGER